MLRQLMALSHLVRVGCSRYREQASPVAMDGWTVGGVNASLVDPSMTTQAALSSSLLHKPDGNALLLGGEVPRAELVVVHMDQLRTDLRARIRGRSCEDEEAVQLT